MLTCSKNYNPISRAVRHIHKTIRINSKTIQIFTSCTAHGSKTRDKLSTSCEHWPNQSQRPSTPTIKTYPWSAMDTLESDTIRKGYGIYL